MLIERTIAVCCSIVLCAHTVCCNNSGNTSWLWSDKHKHDTTWLSNHRKKYFSQNAIPPWRIPVRT